MEENNTPPAPETSEAVKAPKVSLNNISPTILADFVGKGLGLFKKYLCGSFIEKQLAHSQISAKWILTLSIVLLPILGLILGIKLGAFTIFLGAIGASLALILIQFISNNFLDSLAKVSKNAKVFLTTEAISTALGVVYLIGSLGCIVLMVVNLFGKQIPIGIAMFAVAILLFFLACILMSKKLMNIEINEENTPGQELIGLISYFINSMIVAYPIVATLLGAASLTLLVVAIFTSAMESIAYAGIALTGLVYLALLPIIYYLGFLFIYFSIDIYRAILSLLNKKQ